MSKVLIRCPDCGNSTYALGYSKAVDWETKHYSIPERYCHNCKRIILFEIKELKQKGGYVDGGKR